MVWKRMDICLDCTILNVKLGIENRAAFLPSTKATLLLGPHPTSILLYTRLLWFHLWVPTSKERISELLLRLKWEEISFCTYETQAFHMKLVKSCFRSPAVYRALWLAYLFVHFFWSSWLAFYLVSPFIWIEAFQAHYAIHILFIVEKIEIFCH